MHIEIWSDVVCPFCFIGKRKFEAALSQWTGEPITVEWRSFQLDPNAEENTAHNAYERIAQKYGVSLAESQQMHAQVTETAAAVGLYYHFDQVVPTNTSKVHQVIHLAKEKGLQNEAEERFFKAYFEEGQILHQPEVLVRLAEEIGLEREEVESVLEQQTFAKAVLHDQEIGQQIGVQGVPFFVANRKFGLSGAQDPSVFLRWFAQIEAATTNE